MVNGDLVGDGFVNGTWFCESMEFELVLCLVIKKLLLDFCLTDIPW